MIRLASRVGSRVDLLLAVGPFRALEHRWLATRLVRQGSSPRESLALEIWSAAAGTLGADLQRLGGGILEIARDGRSTRVWNHITTLDDAVTLRVALERPLVHRLLLEEDVPVPDYVEFAATRLREGLAFLNGRAGPFVVKPASGSSGGHGVTCAVRSRADLLRATLAAARFDGRLVIERQAAGDMYRLMFLDGELLGAVRRDRPTVTGDGRANVGELIARENRRRIAARGREGLALIRPDLDCVLTLRSQGLGLRSIPQPDSRVVVKTATSENAADENVVVDVPPESQAVEEARAAVTPVGLRFAGVDLVTSDLSRSLRAVGGAVVEVNGTPGLHYHYLVANRDRIVPVAVPVLERLLGEDDGGQRRG